MSEFNPLKEANRRANEEVKALMGSEWTPERLEELRQKWAAHIEAIEKRHAQSFNWVELATESEAALRSAAAEIERLRQERDSAMEYSEAAKADLQAEIERLREDKERLDWIENRCVSVWSNCTSPDDWSVQPSDAECGALETVSANTLREAIDAARGGDDV